MKKNCIIGFLIFTICILFTSKVFADQNSDLLRAAEKGDIATVEKLLEEGANIEARTDYYGRTPIMEATKNNRKDVVELLINKGANINSIAFHGSFVLDFAEYNGYTEIAELLKSYGAVNGHEGYKTPKSYEKARSYKTNKPYELMKNLPSEIGDLREEDPEKFIEKLCHLINTEATNDFERVKMAHDYITCNINYGNGGDQTWLTTVETKIANCRGYTNLFKKMMETLNIPSVKDSGHGRTSIQLSETLKNNHIWNMVQIEGEWYFLDTTWDSKGSTEYLFVKPEDFIYTHFPYNNASQQLLPNLIIKEDFFNLPYLKPIFFEAANFDRKTLAKINNVEESFSFKYTQNNDYTLYFYVKDSNENDIKDAVYIYQDEDENKEQTENNENEIEVVFKFPQADTYKISIYYLRKGGSTLWFCGGFFCKSTGSER